jgi:hypothetical protein
MDIEKWSDPNFMAKKYHQTLKVTMAYIEKNKENMSQNELLDNIIIIEHLVDRICTLQNINHDFKTIHTYNGN